MSEIYTGILKLPVGTHEPEHNLDYAIWYVSNGTKRAGATRISVAYEEQEVPDTDVLEPIIVSHADRIVIEAPTEIWVHVKFLADSEAEAEVIRARCGLVFDGEMDTIAVANMSINYVRDQRRYGK